eukprot:2112624-Pyramimonas_sp.AAC.1
MGPAGPTLQSFRTPGLPGFVLLGLLLFEREVLQGFCRGGPGFQLPQDSVPGAPSKPAEAKTEVLQNGLPESFPFWPVLTEREA